MTRIEKQRQKLSTLVVIASGLRNKAERDSRTMRAIERIEQRIDKVRFALGYRESVA